MIDARLKVFGLWCLAILGLMAFTGAAAQAAGEFEIEGKTFTELGIKEEKIEGSQKGVGTFSVPKMNIEINCQKGTVSSGVLLAGGTGKMTITDSECTVLTLSTKAEMKACPIGEIKEGKFVATNSFPIPLVFLALLVGSKVYALIEPNLNQPLANITFGEECALPSPVKLTGSFATEAPVKEAIEPEFSFNTGSKAGEEIQTLLGDKVLFGTVQALHLSILGLRLAGTHVTLKWLLR